jgi:hypothetical protein
MLLAEPLRSTGELMPWDDAIAVLHHTFAQGITLVDTADIYAPEASQFGYDERLVGEAVRTWEGGRDSIIVVTKIGITLNLGADGEDEWGRDGSYDYLMRAAEASVERLGFVPDTILLHRVNREQQPFAKSVENMLAVREAGFAPTIGIGNVHLDECEVAWDVSGGTISGGTDPATALSTGTGLTGVRNCAVAVGCAQGAPFFGQNITAGTGSWGWGAGGGGFCGGLASGKGGGGSSLYDALVCVWG